MCIYVKTSTYIYIHICVCMCMYTRDCDEPTSNMFKPDKAFAPEAEATE